MKISNRLTASSRIRSYQTDQVAASSTKKNPEASSEAPVMLRRESLRLLTTENVAELLGVAPATLIWWRSQKQGPNWLRLGRGTRAPIRYRPEAIEAYIAQMESAEL
ncbi:helix-turn-helix transcriptional regulator [Microvirga sp. VF16]|uniref:helix-turn-helix transcriptional regulator n=1 Tax=Microvirga sp. VF16 TaxID=2807101 RepID=UPI0035302AE8